MNAGVANGDVTITATTGSIIDDANDATTDITGDVVTLTAAGGVGQVAGNGTLDTRANSLDVSVTGNGVIRIDELDAVTLSDIDTANGSITITAGGAINAVDVQSLTDNDANDIVLTANTGDITVTVVNAGTASGDVTITAVAGAILDDASEANGDDNAVATRITGDVVTLIATGAIGTDAVLADIDTTANRLDVQSTTTGTVFLNETDAVFVDRLTSNDGNVGLVTGGTITLVGPATAGGAGRDLSMRATAGDVLLNGPTTAAGDRVAIRSQAGKINGRAW